MPTLKPFLLSVATCLLLLPATIFGQTKPEQKPPEPPPRGNVEDVIKFDTSLVQTDVMVFDKNGRFVEGLKPDQFQLKVNNTPREISFFEAIKSGGRKGEEPKTDQPGAVDPAKAIAQRRSVIFFVDDLHLAPDSIERTQKSLLEFINRGMGENDMVAITSPSGQIGFLQQFTASKDALRLAVSRLIYRGNNKSDMGSPPMSEYIAMKIREGDESAMTFYVIEMQKQACFRAGNQVICSMSPQSIRQQIRNRAQQIVQESAPSTDDTLRLLEGLMRSAA